MSSNKNQHYVPKAYLRSFASDGERCTNLYAINQGKSVRDASIRDQCSRNYFYGNEPKFESFLQFFEGRYGDVLNRLRQGQLERKDLFTLFRFFILQHLRTPQKLEQRLDVVDAFRNTVIGGKALHEVHEDAKRPTDLQREMQEQIYISASANEYLHDLEPVLLVNNTKMPFITSDNPACLTNRLYTQRYRDETSGLVQSGVAIFMPLSPLTAFFAYDREVYEPVGKDWLLQVRNERDVDRVNELQAQVASSTLFFNDWNDREYVAQLAKRMTGARRNSWSFIWTGIKIGEDEEYERFRAVTEADNESKEPRITSVSMYMPAPSTWPSFLHFKMRPRGLTTGSAVGYVRASEAHRKDRDFRAVVLPSRIPAHHCPQHREIMYLRRDHGPSKPRKV